MLEWNGEQRHHLPMAGRSSTTTAYSTRPWCQLKSQSVPYNVEGGSTTWLI